MYCKSSGAFTERFINDAIGRYGVTDSYRKFRLGSWNALQWKNNYLERINASAGYAISENHTILLDLAYNLTKKGYGHNFYSIDQAIINGGESPISEFEFSQFHLLGISLSDEIYILKSIFLHLGLTYNHFSLNVNNNYNPSYNIFTDSYSGTAYGLATGIGYSRPFTENIDIVGKALYSYSYYNDNDFGVDGLRIDINGYSLGLELRYNLGM